MINTLPVLIVIWAVLTGLFLALLAYNATITRYEENQLFLDDASINAVEQQEQNSILRKVHKLLPAIRTLGILSAIFTVLIIAIYTWDCWQKLQAQ
jgi:cytochrome b